MALRVTPEMRERAKADGKFLFQISLDAKFVPAEVLEQLKGQVFSGKWEMTGPMLPEDAVKIWKLFWELRKADRV